MKIHTKAEVARQPQVMGWVKAPDAAVNIRELNDTLKGIISAYFDTGGGSPEAHTKFMHILAKGQELTRKYKAEIGELPGRESYAELLNERDHYRKKALAFAETINRLEAIREAYHSGAKFRGTLLSEFFEVLENGRHKS